MVAIREPSHEFEAGGCKRITSNKTNITCDYLHDVLKCITTQIRGSILQFHSDLTHFSSSESTTGVKDYFSEQNKKAI